MKELDNWKTCPSVTTGGKPVFYRKEDVFILWDRMNHGWRIEKGQKKSALFRTAQEAAKAYKIKGEL